MYKILISKSALKELKDIPKIFRGNIISKINDLAIEPRPNGVRKLEGFKNSYRVRIGNYRVVYKIEDSELIIEVVKISDRKDVYRNK
jgi:mRNA interferase RelE/StbE